MDDWMRSLDPEARAAVVNVVDLLEEHGAALALPHARPLGEGLWELRARSPGGIQRVIYFHWFGRTFGLLHGFTKKTRQTPRTEIDTARRRQATWLARERGTPRNK
ncbi:MAG: type II toxin-antitoxin system RelE/ParE family toxin [Dehalococcoidia bacterium]|nr:type II toxin-antitoxin system RelE/ParE family toxin [Dehalococcoidia bacterium]